MLFISTIIRKITIYMSISILGKTIISQKTSGISANSYFKDYYRISTSRYINKYFYQTNYFRASPILLIFASDINVIYITYNIKQGFCTKKRDVERQKILAKYFQYKYNKLFS